ncbi:MAG TPA: P-loop NTPase fold protein [Flavipsychrobacter sp.]|nr:P-loop NTPase fold protein [Flavipsychrobacter sp.]
MKRLIDPIKLYLQKETNNCLLITGKWGTGKTYFFKHQLSKTIGEIETLDNSQKKFFIVYISLFGVNSIEELSRKIFLEINPLFKGNLAKGAKIIARLLMTVTNLGDIDKYIKDINIAKVKTHGYGQIVLCLDDIERKGENLKIKELCGFLNNLTDLSGQKILLIADDVRIKENEEDYNTLKEKVIGIQIEFPFHFDYAFNSVLKEYVTGRYENFLQQNKLTIQEYLSLGDNNLRNLVYFITYFQDVFYEIEKYCDENEKTNNRLCTLLKDELSSILKFAFAISIEFRQQQISFLEKKGLDSIYSIMDSLLKQAGGEAEKTYREKFIEKYYFGSSYSFYLSVYEHFTGGSAFAVEKLVNELREIHNVIENTSEIEGVWSKLSYSNVFKLDDDEYKKQTEFLKTLATKGDVYVEQYVNVFHFLTRFDNPLEYDMDSLKQELINGILISIQKNYSREREPTSKWLIESHFNHNPELKKLPPQAIDIKDEIVATIKEYWNNDEKKKIELIKEIIYEKIDEWEQYFNAKETKEYFSQSIFDKINFDEFIEKFKKFNNSQYYSLVVFFEKRYQGTVVLEYFISEKAFILKLKSFLESEIGYKRSIIQTEIYKLLLETINRFLSYLP